MEGSQAPGKAGKLTLALSLGSGCSAAVESIPRNRAVVGLNSAECLAFLLFSILSEVCPEFRSLEEAQHY